jgi:hypothetical protein
LELKCNFLALLGLVFSLVLHANVFAHGVGMQITQKGKSLIVEGYYEDNSPTSKAKVQLASKEGVEITTQAMNEKGMAEIQIPGVGEFRITLDTGDGHLFRKVIRISQTEISGESILGSGPNRKQYTGKNTGVRVAIGLGLIGILAIAIKIFWKPVSPQGSK